MDFTTPQRTDYLLVGNYSARSANTDQSPPFSENPAPQEQSSSASHTNSITSEPTEPEPTEPEPPTPEPTSIEPAEADLVRSGEVAVVNLDAQGLLGNVHSAIKLPNPSFVHVAEDGEIVAVLEEEVGQLVGLGHSPDLPEQPLWQVASHGSIPCHVNSNGTVLAVAHYGDGVASLWRQDPQTEAASNGQSENGDLVGGRQSGQREETGGPEMQGTRTSSPELLAALRQAGSGPVSPDQDGPRAHQSIPVDNGFLASDLGADKIYDYQPDDAGEFVLKDELNFPAGTGPRHMAMLGRYLFVVGELDSRLHVAYRGTDGLEYVGSQPTVEKPGVKSVPSHVAFDDQKRFLYVANRFRDTIAVFDCQEFHETLPPTATEVGGAEHHASADAAELESEDPGPRYIQPVLVGEFDCGGHIPRHFLLTHHPFSGTKILIANQESDSIDVFEIKAHSGILGQRLQSVPWQKPSCLVHYSAGEQ